ncbi:unnamed protein product [Arctia plantaginis]|uniref:PHD-type domain-containing protein n=1 Tax=Arctia plantaginis TaxID=874455 RepID=A0A8S1B1C3_ARCPL|nr:unnamed protein product [Arctia plantaginis]
MAKCAKCSKVITKKFAGLQCGRCNKWWHASCASLTTEQLGALTAVESADWKCKPCSNQTNQRRISAILPDEEDENTDSEIAGLANHGSMMQEIRRQIRETIQEEMKRSLQFFSDKFDEFQEAINSYEEKIKIIDRQYKDLNNKYTHIKNKSEFMEQKINAIDRLEMEAESVIKVYRKQNKSTDGQKRNAGTLVITLKEDQRDAWLEAAKTKVITERDIGREEHSDNCYYLFRGNK